jgi:hypothetical protein
MSIGSINQPQDVGRDVTFYPQSINVPTKLEDWIAENVPEGGELPPGFELPPGVEPPATDAAVITALEPSEAPAGSSVELLVQCTGHNEKKSYIYFGDAEMRTQLATQTSISTVIPSNEMISPRLVNVTVRRGEFISNQMPFNVLPYEKEVADPDELEEEIEAAEEEGDFVATHKAKPKRKR